jgi:phage antirepressor YoqD-like protein
MEALDDPDTLRSLLLSYSGKVKTLEVQVSTLAPKAEALDRIATTGGSLCITDAAKTLQVPPRELFRYLRSNGWVYSRAGGSEIGYQEHINAGRLEHKTTTVSRSDGSEKTVTQVRITPKGLTGLAMAFRLSQPVPAQAVSASLL